MNARRRLPGAVIARGVITVAFLTLATIGLAAIFLRPPLGDLGLLAVFLPVSGATSLAVGLGFVTLYRGRLLHGVRGKLLLALLVSAVLILLNVGFTSYLMFFSSHDLTLVALLMAYSLGLSAFFAVTVAEQFQGSLGLLLEGLRRLGEGDFDTQVDVDTGDEMEDIAAALNSMARELRQAAATRRDMEEARRHLIGAVSHDLRTPLATMRAMIESINDGIVTEPETIRRYHRTMQGEIEYLSRLIHDLFELSQLDSGLLELSPEAGSVSDLVSDTLEALRPQAEQRQLVLSGEVPPYLPSVVMDVPRMQRVLYNLVQNALRHTPADGRVVIRAAATEDEVRVSVQDSGEGLDVEELPRIFERFYRGNRARNREEAGSGLGLTIAKGIVELHGGKIWADSQRGQGAVFTFTIPKAVALEPVG